MIIKANWIFRYLLKGYLGITLFPFILYTTKYMNGLSLPQDRIDKLLRHEKRHLKQQIVFLIIPFYLIYVANYLINLIKYKDHQKAYRNILFEIDARKHTNGQ